MRAPETPGWRISALPRPPRHDTPPSPVLQVPSFCYCSFGVFLLSLFLLSQCFHNDSHPGSTRAAVLTDDQGAAGTRGRNRAPASNKSTRSLQVASSSSSDDLLAGDHAVRTRPARKTTASTKPSTSTKQGTVTAQLRRDLEDANRRNAVLQQAASAAVRMAALLPPLPEHLAQLKVRQPARTQKHQREASCTAARLFPTTPDNADDAVSPLTLRERKVLLCYSLVRLFVDLTQTQPFNTIRFVKWNWKFAKRKPLRSSRRSRGREGGRRRRSRRDNHHHHHQPHHRPRHRRQHHQRQPHPRNAGRRRNRRLNGTRVRRRDGWLSQHACVLLQVGVIVRGVHSAP